MKINDFKGTFKLLKLAARRDRIKLPVWIICISGIIALIVKSYAMISPEEMKEIVAMASMNPGMRLLLAPVAIEGAGELGQFFLLRMSLIIAILIGIMNIQFVMRHTRGNEETGCQELIASGVAGKYGSLTGTLLLGFFANIVLGLLIFLGFAANSLEITGSILSGLSFAFLGFLLCSLAAVTAQLSETSKGCSGIVSMIMAVLFSINSIGNALGEVNEGGMGFEGSWLVYLSPLGWVQQIHAFGSNNFALLFPIPLLSILFIGLAFFLVNKRDIGRGLVQARKGRKDAPKWMKSSLGIAFRLQRKSLIAWMIPLVFFGFIFGAASQEYADVVENIEMFELLKVTSELFLFAFIGVFAGVITIYTMQSLLRMRSEESNGPLDNLLSTSVKRSSFALSHIFVSLAGSFVLLLVFTLSVSLAAENLSDSLGEYFKVVISQAGAITVICGMIVLIYGIIPKSLTLLSGILVFAGIMAGPFFGAVLKLPDFVLNLSPFAYAPANPSDFSATSTVILFSVGIVLLILGVWAFSKRNLELQGEK